MELEGLGKELETLGKQLEGLGKELEGFGKELETLGMEFEVLWYWRRLHPPSCSTLISTVASAKRGLFFRRPETTLAAKSRFSSLRSSA
jgi:hypothetical protein